MDRESVSAASTHDAPANQDNWRQGVHVPQLDGVRGLAILIVTLYRFSKELPTDTWLGQFLHLAFKFGDRGVELFFVLSGFLITGILVDAKGQPNYFKNFFARRSLRIFPLYFVAIFFLLFVLPLMFNKELFAQATQNQFFLWTYLTNVQMSLQDEWCFGYMDHFWSLAVEEHFYLVWPFVIFLCSPKLALRVALAGALMSAVGRLGFAAISSNGVAPDVLTIFRIDALLIGALIALQIRTSEGIRWMIKPAMAVFAVCLLMGIGCGVMGKRVFTISHTLWPLIWGCIMIWLLTGKQRGWLGRLFNLSALRKLGKYSYAMYVFQSPLIPITAGVLSVTTLTNTFGNYALAHFLYIGLMFVLTYAAALLSWYVLERHCLKLKHFFENRKPQAA